MSPGSLSTSSVSFVQLLSDAYRLSARRNLSKVLSSLSSGVAGLGRFQEFLIERYTRSVDRVHDSTPSGLCRFLLVVHRRQSEPISPVGKCVSRLAGIPRKIPPDGKAADASSVAPAGTGHVSAVGVISLDVMPYLKFSESRLSRRPSVVSACGYMRKPTGAPFDPGRATSCP